MKRTGPGRAENLNAELLAVFQAVLNRLTSITRTLPEIVDIGCGS